MKFFVNIMFALGSLRARFGGIKAIIILSRRSSLFVSLIATLMEAEVVSE